MKISNLIINTNDFLMNVFFLPFSRMVPSSRPGQQFRGVQLLFRGRGVNEGHPLPPDADGRRTDGRGDRLGRLLLIHGGRRLPIPRTQEEGKDPYWTHNSAPEG